MLTVLGSLDAVLFVEPLHQHRVDENQDDKDVDRPLLGEPESEREAAEVELVEGFDEHDAETEGDDKPHGEQHGHQAEIRAPIRIVAGRGFPLS